jgi:hypothetical protein
MQKNEVIFVLYFLHFGESRRHVTSRHVKSRHVVMLCNVMSSCYVMSSRHVVTSPCHVASRNVVTSRHNIEVVHLSNHHYFGKQPWHRGYVTAQ